MRRLITSHVSFFTVASLLALGFATVACGGSDSSDDDDASGGTAGTGGTGGGADQIVWDSGGFAAPDANPFMIQGPWYSYNDCNDATPLALPCTMPDAGLMGPDMLPGWNVEANKVCFKGTAAKVEMEMYAKQWGAGIALDLNSPGGTAMPVKNPFNADAAGLKGFMFDVTGTAPMQVRVNLTSVAAGNDSHFVPITVPTMNAAVNFVDAMQGSWVPTKVPFTPDAILAVQFQVFTNNMSATPYDFCVSNMRGIRK